MYMTANLAIPAFEAAPAPAEQALDALFAGQSLTADQAEALFAELVAGRLAEPSIAALLIALRLKGETADELIGAARALRAADADFPRPDYVFADSCGTGGDGSGTINLSTAVAFVAAAAGLPVAKHGNRSITSKCGSADVLEALGVKLDASAARLAPGAGRGGRLLPVRARLSSRPAPCRAGAPGAQGADGDEHPRPLREPGRAPGAIARRRRGAADRAGRADPAGAGRRAGDGRAWRRARRGRAARADRGGAAGRRQDRAADDHARRCRPRRRADRAAAGRRRRPRMPSG